MNNNFPNNSKDPSNLKEKLKESEGFKVQNFEDDKKSLDLTGREETKEENLPPVQNQGNSSKRANSTTKQSIYIFPTLFQ